MRANPRHCHHCMYAQLRNTLFRPPPRREKRQNEGIATAGGGQLPPESPVSRPPSLRRSPFAGKMAPERRATEDIALNTHGRFQRPARASGFFSRGGRDAPSRPAKNPAPMRPGTRGAVYIVGAVQKARAFQFGGGSFDEPPMGDWPVEFVRRIGERNISGVSRRCDNNAITWCTVPPTHFYSLILPEQQN